MHHDETRKIEELACTFRRAIESCLPDLGAAFRHFPRGSCGDATVLLGTYLTENVIAPFDYTNGVRGPRRVVPRRDMGLEVGPEEFCTAVLLERWWLKQVGGRRHVSPRP